MNTLKQGNYIVVKDLALYILLVLLFFYCSIL